MSGVSLENLLRAEEHVAKTPKHVEAKTLDAFHTQQLTKLREEKQTLASLKEALEIKKAKLAVLEKEFASPSIILNANDIVILTSRQHLENEIKEDERTIQKIERGDNEADYFLRIGDILFSYSDAQDRIATGEKPVETVQVRKETSVCRKPN